MPEAFYERLPASVPDLKTGKPDPAQTKAFLSQPHPGSVRRWKMIKKESFSLGF